MASSGFSDDVFGAYVPSEIREEWRAEDRAREHARRSSPPARPWLWRSFTTGVGDAVITVFGQYAPRDKIEEFRRERALRSENALRKGPKR